jgi:hypothetical protein
MTLSAITMTGDYPSASLRIRYELQLHAAAEGPAQGDLICVVEVSTHRQA